MRHSVCWGDIDDFAILHELAIARDGVTGAAAEADEDAIAGGCRRTANPRLILRRKAGERHSGLPAVREHQPHLPRTDSAKLSLDRLPGAVRPGA